MENIAAVVGGKMPVYNDIFIMYHSKENNNPLMVRLDKWTSNQDSGEIADGVALVSGNKILVVAPTEGYLLWSNAAVVGGGKNTTDLTVAMEDMNGKANTAAQIAHDECKGKSHAPGYCATYSRVNANGKGLSAGKWWLPSMGELMMISANIHIINHALLLINGATLLSESWYWTSTESTSSNAWSMTLSNNFASPSPKERHKVSVRPVSTFIW